MCSAISFDLSWGLTSIGTTQGLLGTEESEGLVVVVVVVVVVGGGVIYQQLVPKRSHPQRPRRPLATI